MQIIYAFPIFALLLLIEFGYGYFKRRNTYHDMKDTVASLTLGVSQVGFTVLFASVMIVINYFLYDHRIFEFGTSWYELLLLFLIMDFSFYWWHRASHRVRFLWANHVNHHSSKEYNFSTALRQPVFSPVLRPLFYLYIPLLGFDPAVMTMMGVVALAWGVLSHTKHIGKLGPLEYVFVTPSHHRVHHGSNPQYIDKNYAGTFSFWDRMFGTFEPEQEEVVYGLTKNIDTYNPIKIIFHGWVDWINDLKRSSSLREALDYTFSPPKTD